MRRLVLVAIGLLAACKTPEAQENGATATGGDVGAPPVAAADTPGVTGNANRGADAGGEASRGTEAEPQDTSSYRTVETKEAFERIKSGADGEVGWGKSLGRFTYGFYGGAILSKERGDFSETDVFLRFKSDLSYEPERSDEGEIRDGKSSLDWDPDDIHSWIDISLTALPAKANVGGNEFLNSKKALTGSAGLDWRVLQWDPVDSYTVSVAPSAMVGLATFADSLTPEEQAADLDSVTSRWGIGLKFAGTPARGVTVKIKDEPEETWRHPNPLPRHFASFHYGDDDAIGPKRLMIDSALIVDEKSGLFVGFEANLGEGRDDVRVVFGFATALNNLFQAVQGLVPDVIK